MNQRARLDPVPIPFIDVAAQRRRLGRSVDEAIARVLGHCQFILGPEVRALEAELAAFCGARHAVTCASGTDALVLALMAQGIGSGDAVICPSFTFTATAEVVALVGATPVFADVEEASFNLDPESLQRACAAARELGLRPRAVIPVDLFGQPADHDRIASVAAAQELFVLDDAAQAFGATYKNRRLGTLAPATATSFFPAKPLGCYGDGGAVLTDDEELAQVMRSLRVHGEGGGGKYDCVRIGMNGRLDTIQAAVKHGERSFHQAIQTGRLRPGSRKTRQHGKFIHQRAHGFDGMANRLRAGANDFERSCIGRIVSCQMAFDALGRKRDWSQRIFNFMRHASRHFAPCSLFLRAQQIR